MSASNLFGKALESAPDAIVIADAAGRILFANRRVLDVLGYDPAELLGRQIEVLLPQELRERHLSHRAGYMRQPRARPMGINLGLTALRKDGTQIPVEISLSPIEDGDRVLTATAIRDVTDRKRILQELQQAREAADRANLAKSRFLATASHDLRQPLQALALLNGSLRRMALDENQLEAVNQQERAVTTMSRLLNALLDISKLEAGVVRTAPVDFGVRSLFEDLRSEFAGLAASKGLQLEIEPGSLVVHSDPDLVGQVLRNLLANAIKYTSRGYVRLSARGDGLRVHFELRDTGIGIPPDKLPFIYDEFFQAGAAAADHREGYGLGLSIVRRIVTLLRLKLDICSDVGVGTCCTLELPAGRNAAHVSAAAVVAPAGTTRATQPQVLLVDDDSGVRNATALLLRVVGCRVFSAGSVSEAAEVAHGNPGIDVVLTDYHLGAGETGLDVIKQVRDILQRRCSAVLVTGDTSAAIQARAAEDIRLVSKPIRSDELLALIHELAPG